MEKLATNLSMKTLCLILARKGSKGLKNKNLKTIKNKSLIELAVLSGLESKMIDKIILSSDYKKKELDKISGYFLIKRSKQLSGDNVLSYTVIRDIILNLKKKKLPEYIVLLEPPCPFRNGKLIDKVVKFAIEKKATSVVTFKIIQDPHPIRVKKISKEGRVSDYIISEPKKGFPRQKQKRAYLRDQAVYVLKTENFTKSKNLYGENPYGLINDKNITVNIDSYLDYKLAETISKDKLFKSKILLPEFKQFENLEKLITKKKLV